MFEIKKPSLKISVFTVILEYEWYMNYHQIKQTLNKKYQIILLELNL